MDVSEVTTHSFPCHNRDLTGGSKTDGERRTFKNPYFKNTFFLSFLQFVEKNETQNKK